MRKNLLVLFTLLSFALPSFALANNDGDKNKKASVTISAEERKMAEAITAEQLKDYLTFISSDAMGGRDTPSAGLDITAQFIALNLKKWGFKPAGDDGTFFQRMTVRKTKSVTADGNSLSIGDKDFTFGDDMLRIQGNGMAEAPVVFGGNGWMVKAKNIDAFAGVDVKDKIVAIYNPDFSGGSLTPRPKDVTSDDLKGEQGVDWADPITYAKAKGAKGVIVIVAPALEPRWALVQRFLTGGGGMSIDGLQDGPAASDDDMPLMLVKSNIAKELFADVDGDQNSPKAFETDKSAKLSVKGVVEKVPTQNVVAIWEADKNSPVKDEMVAIGAHYDHVGTNENAPGEDKIWNGADDDGSGTTGVLAIAEALATAAKNGNKRPKRSVLFVWHAGEEKGLLGAKYFNKFPTVDIKKVIAQLNIDMIGRSKTADTKIVKCTGRNRCNEELAGPNEVYVIGSEMMSSKLGEITKATNSSYMNMDYNYKYDDPKDTNRFFFRSDHFEYAQNGIPIAFWFTGVHMDYHQASDEVDKIDFVKMEKIARTIFLTMWELTELKDRPVIDKKLPKELTRNN